jgi:hypothetical protein
VEATAVAEAMAVVEAMAGILEVTALAVAVSEAMGSRWATAVSEAQGRDKPRQFR